MPSNGVIVEYFMPGATNDAKIMVPMTGSVTAQPHPTLTQLNSANVNSSPVGWYVKNEHASKTIRIGDASLTDTTGYPIGPGESHYIASSSLASHYVVSPDGPVKVSVWGES